MQLQDGWDMDALWERTDFVWTLTWLGHGCFVGTRMLDANTGKTQENAKTLRYNTPDFVWTLTWDAGCKHRKTQKP